MAIDKTVKDAVKVTRRTFFSPRSWLDFDMVKDNTTTVIGLFKDTFRRETPARTETFEQALKRLNISSEEVENVKLNYLSFAIFFLLIGFVLVGFGIYFLLKFYILDFLLALGISAILFAQAFRFHFFYFQIKHRKLGCTFEEWRTGRLKDEGPQA